MAARVAGAAMAAVDTAAAAAEVTKVKPLRFKKVAGGLDCSVG